MKLRPTLIESVFDLSHLWNEDVVARWLQAALELPGLVVAEDDHDATEVIFKLRMKTNQIIAIRNSTEERDGQVEGMLPSYYLMTPYKRLMIINAWEKTCWSRD